MEIKVIRSVFNSNSTLGKMLIDGEFYAFTMEDTYRDLRGNCSKKIQNQTSVDYGRYEVVLSFSDHFQKFLPLLMNVPCFNGIRIHGGNTAADTEGCILIGAESNMKDHIGNCAGKVAGIVEKLKAASNTGKIFIEIVKESV